MTNSDLHTFNFSGLELRVIMQEGEPWFVARDVCFITGSYLSPAGNPNVTMLVQKLNADETQFNRIEVRVGKAVAPRRVVLVSESGLYKLIMRSDKPEARKFQDWVTRDVLPSIRKTGGYLLNEEARDNAHADDRQGMPLPEAFAQMFDLMMQQQAVTNQLLAQLLAERNQAPNEKPKDERRIRKLITAFEAADKFDIEASSPEIGMRASAYCRERGIKYSSRRNNAYGKINVYPTYVFKDMLAEGVIA
ncbi:hypothetical protein DEM27_12450 [Metarhizobium album]|uniref:Bro-N domain-containing protein n=1 Tax=Metarhizobium album TaxID=2182425 RepID=A0A2U2DSD6_9HYPH|nr:BRO family protein [Rhizobium album]PWE56230.1 hypothetical protein DEM27_12450 [Rhizobium album]